MREQTEEACPRSHGGFSHGGAKLVTSMDVPEGLRHSCLAHNDLIKLAADDWAPWPGSLWDFCLQVSYIVRYPAHTSIAVDSG